MADWTDIPTSSLEPDKPIRSIDALSLRDNPIAIAQRSSGAPRVQPHDMEILTGSGSWAVPEGVTRIKYTLVGGGGGAGGSTSSPEARWGGGGSGGEAVIGVMTVTPGQTIAYECGAGGAGGSGSTGDDGGNTTFNTSIVAQGGNGGYHGTSEPTVLRGGFAAQTPPRISIPGGVAVRTLGGASINGGPGVGATASALGFGAGGNGSSPASNSTGGAGSAGMILLEY